MDHLKVFPEVIGLSFGLGLLLCQADLLVLQDVDLLFERIPVPLETAPLADELVAAALLLRQAVLQLLDVPLPVWSKLKLRSSKRGQTDTT